MIGKYMIQKLPNRLYTVTKVGTRGYVIYALWPDGQFSVLTSEGLDEATIQNDFNAAFQANVAELVSSAYGTSESNAEAQTNETGVETPDTN